MDAAERAGCEQASLPQNLVFVDVETTGASPAYHRVIEVGLVRFENDVQVEQWSVLVNPQAPIPPNITSFTGISNEMVSCAPVFAEIARDVYEKLAGALFVAHNARFDYAFLHRELLRAGLHLAAPALCTVKLSRRLYPEHARHNLDVVMERHRIVCEARHRALGDALVLRDLWRGLRGAWPPAELAAAVQKSMLGGPQLPAHLPPELADELPDGPGVYRYFAADGTLLFVGRSNSLRPRILQQLGDPRAGSRDVELSGEVRRVDWAETAGELGALLREAQLIRTCKPRYNRRLRESTGATLRPSVDHSGRVDVLDIDDLDARTSPECFGVFRGEKDARKALVELARARTLCLKVLGIETGEGSCLAMQMGKCKGACVGKEPLLLHETRLRMALAALKIRNWPFAGRVALREQAHGVTEYHVLEHWAYLGTARSEEELAALGGRAQTESRAAEPIVFDADVYRILVRYFSNHGTYDCHDLREAPVLN